MPMRDRLARLVQRNPERPSLRERAAALKASAAQVIRRRQRGQVNYQPDSASLLAGRFADEGQAVFRGVEPAPHDGVRGHPAGADRADAAAGRAPQQEHAMGRHETFENATALSTTLAYLSGHQPCELDPIFGAIEKTHALHAVQQAAYAVCGDLPDAAPEWEPEREAYRAWFDHIDNVLMRTVPTTAAGCVALARFTVDFCAEEEIPLSQDREAGDTDNIGPLRLIAQSPALAGAAALADPAEDPVFAAIEAHASARDAFSATVNASDRAWVAQHGGDVSDAAMASAKEDSAAASDAEDAAWDMLLRTRPTTTVGLLSWAQHVTRWVGEHDHSYEGDGLKPAFEAFVAGLSGVLAGGNEREAVDWWDAAPGFMAFPAFEPVGFRRVLDALPEEVARLHCAASAEFKRRMACMGADVPEDERQAFAAQLRADLLLAPLTAAAEPESAEALALAALNAPAEVSAKPDPIFAALDACRAPEAEREAFHAVHSVGTTGPGYTFEREIALDSAAEAAFNTVFATTPTTQDGRLALIAFIKRRIEWSACPDGSPQEGEGTVFAQAYRSLARAIEAEVPEAAEEGIAKSFCRAVDLKALDIKDLSHLAFWAESLMTMASGLARRGGRRPLGRFFDQVSNGLSDVVGKAQDELQGRTPTDWLERECRLKTIALPVIENGDADELESLIADLQIEVAYLRKPMSEGVAVRG